MRSSYQNIGKCRLSVNVVGWGEWFTILEHLRKYDLFRHFRDLTYPMPLTLLYVSADFAASGTSRRNSNIGYYRPIMGSGVEISTR